MPIASLTAAPTAEPEPLVITIAMTLSFADELSSDEIVDVCGAILEDVLDSNDDFLEEWVACDMAVNSGGSARHILTSSTTRVLSLPFQLPPLSTKMAEKT